MQVKSHLDGSSWCIIDMIFLRSSNLNITHSLSDKVVGILRLYTHTHTHHFYKGRNDVVVPKGIDICLERAVKDDVRVTILQDPSE